MMIKRTRYFSTLIIFSISTFILTQLFNLATNPMPKPQQYKLDKLEQMVKQNQQSLKTLHHKFSYIETLIASKESTRKTSLASRQLSSVFHPESKTCDNSFTTQPSPGSTQSSSIDKAPTVKKEVHGKFKDKVASAFAQEKMNKMGLTDDKQIQPKRI